MSRGDLPHGSASPDRVHFCCYASTGSGRPSLCDHGQPLGHATRSGWQLRAARAAAEAEAGVETHRPELFDGSTLLVYVVDLYDPRARDYQPSVNAVLREAVPPVDVEVVQSGRYASLAAAAALIALLATDHEDPGAVLDAVQDEFFVGGRALDEPGVLAAVSDRLGVDGEAVELFAHSERALELAREDVALAKELDARGGPMLLASRGQRLFEFDGPGASGQRLVDQFRTVLERS
jgi:hypothetical protein